MRKAIESELRLLQEAAGALRGRVLEPPCSPDPRPFRAAAEGIDVEVQVGWGKCSAGRDGRPDLWVLLRAGEGKACLCFSCRGMGRFCSSYSWSQWASDLLYEHLGCVPARVAEALRLLREARAALEERTREAGEWKVNLLREQEEAVREVEAWAAMTGLADEGKGGS